MGRKKKKFVFVTGGVVSSLGKGLAGASLGALLENRGLKVAHAKLDPYLNVDPGTMSPFQHGEVYVTDDGAETDLDLGHYERFTEARLSQRSNTTSGRIYESVIRKERAGEYLGKTVQVIPHVTDEIKLAIHQAIDDEDILICEIGGTVGDIESLPFLEAIRQFRYEVGEDNVLYIHLTLVPYIKAAGELKTKPTQHSVQKLREIGIQPDILLCRVEGELDQDLRRKIALFTNVSPESVFASQDVESIYELPLALKKEGLDDRIAELLNIWSRAPRLERWETIVDKIKHPKGEVEIGVVGKYVELIESYKSLNEALTHGGIASDVRVNLRYVEAEAIEVEGAAAILQGVDGVLVPGGFGKRGTEGKITAVQWARENKIPFFGICLGLQMAVIEYARNVVALEGAHSVEFEEACAHPVVSLMEAQKEITDKGGTMRLGAYPCALKQGSRARAIYGGKELISERHRHRFEVNNDYRTQLEEAGMVFSGLNPDLDLVEMVELPDHPYFVACQFHPEFKSKPFLPHPLFSAFVGAARDTQEARQGESGPTLVHG
ncbi:MAG: CTP synthase [Deltaproteobacteria bacterium]|nr:CTP synthase [Deltaproteobacteria bacterium]